MKLATKEWVLDLIQKVNRRNRSVQTYYTVYGNAGTITYDDDIQFAFVAYNGSRYSYFIYNQNNPDGYISTYLRRYSSTDTTYSVYTTSMGSLKVEGNQLTWAPISSNYTGNYIIYTVPAWVKMHHKKVTLDSTTTIDIPLDIIPNMVYVEKAELGDNKTGNTCYFYVKKNFNTYTPSHQYQYYCGWRDSNSQVAINDGGRAYFLVDKDVLKVSAVSSADAYKGEFNIYYF